MRGALRIRQRLMILSLAFVLLALSFLDLFLVVALSLICCFVSVRHRLDHVDVAHGFGVLPVDLGAFFVQGLWVALGLGGGFLCLLVLFLLFTFFEVLILKLLKRFAVDFTVCL